MLVGLWYLGAVRLQCLMNLDLFLDFSFVDVVK